MKNKIMSSQSIQAAPEAAPSSAVPTATPGMLLEESSQSAERSCSHDTSEEEKSTTRNTTSKGEEGSSSASSSRHQIGKAETVAVNRSKMLVFLCLACFSIATAVATWYIVSTEETNDFVVAYNDFAEEMVENAENNAELIFGQIKGLATSITSHALALNQSWPFVTLPHFDIQTSQAGILAGSELIIFAPIVNEEDVHQWEQYAVGHQDWMVEDMEYRGWNDIVLQDIGSREVIFPVASGSEDDFIVLDVKVPVWQFGPGVVDSSLVGMDLFTHPTFRRIVNDVRKIPHDVLSEIVDLQFLLGYTNDTMNATYHPRSIIAEPVLEDFKNGSKVVGMVFAIEPWGHYFERILPHGVNGFVVDVEETCGTSFTIAVDGPEAHYHGEGDLHDPKYKDLAFPSEFATFAGYDYANSNSSEFQHCEYTVYVYPSAVFEESFHTSDPYVFAAVVFFIFIFTTLVFVLYDYLVQRRQNKVLSTAQRTAKIVTSLFPKEIGKRLLEESAQQQEKEEGRGRFGNAAKKDLRSFLNDDPNDSLTTTKLQTSSPIADFFPETTIMFADIVGFTAWASSREPAQVFTLLENIYNAFDLVAKRRRVYKVETVGDCYVAVAGLPEPRKDHQTVMARFARDCLYRFSIIVKQLEIQLGPGTGDLGLRVGLHSGAVTAGVLRTDNARFQLFGDTMNVAARMEHTGAKNRIQVSQATADLLLKAGKGQWVRPRTDKVDAKGKGLMQTHWLDIQAGGSKRSSEGETNSENSTSHIENNLVAGGSKSNTEENDKVNDRKQRLVDWNVDVLCKALKQVVARREAINEQPDSLLHMEKLEQSKLRLDQSKIDAVVPLDEIVECISLPNYNVKAAAVTYEKDASSIDLGEAVQKQLHDYVRGISAMYHEDNAFHNFEHASHVTMSVSKLLSRIVAPADLEYNEKDSSETVAKSLHDHTYGITSDPLTRFAVILSALWHDVDHAGVPNAQLVKENAPVAGVYKNRSVAEQNSVELAWSLLMDHQFSDLRRAIYINEVEFRRFRELVVNSVLATDIMDKELGQLRKKRWNDAFSADAEQQAAAADDEAAKTYSTNRKATIVLEHLIQASDVSHTMQHWHVYRKWNAKLYEEMYQAYVDGRAERDPADFWYEGEKGFLDFYVIPLANKLKECGVFGVSSDEYLVYARLNRAEWEVKGQAIVEELKEQMMNITQKIQV